MLNAPTVLLNGAVDAWLARGGATSKEARAPVFVHAYTQTTTFTDGETAS